MNRADRRAIMFGRKEAPRAVRPVADRPDFVSQVIVIPNIENAMSVFQVMAPEDQIPAEFFKVINMLKNLPDEGGTVSTPQDYAMLLHHWFFMGLSEFNPDLLPHVQVAPDATFIQYVGTILRDTSPSREHKFAYLTMLLTRCCKSISWKPVVSA